MIKRIMITALIACFVFALNFNAGATSRAGYKTVVDQKRPATFMERVKKLSRTCLLYIPNRIVDAADIFSFNVYVGNSFVMEMQATRFAQIGGSTGQSYFFTKGYKRQFGFGRKKCERAGLAYGEKDETVVYETTGSVKEYSIYFPNFLTANDRLDAFQNDDVDFWKLGGNMGWFFGGGFAMHPIEVADFFTGLVGIDISEDDF